MSGETYAIVFKGEIVEGFAADTVKAQLAKLLKTDAKKTAALFSGKQIVLKKTTDRAEAAKYGKALKKVGADVKIRIIKAGTAATAAPVKPAAAPVKPAAAPAAETPPEPEAPVMDTSGISLAPNEGDLFDPVPRAVIPEIDLSSFSVAENDGSPLVEPSAEVVVELDLSEFSVKDNDGTALVEHEDEAIPPIEVPDFGLDEPGAVLETLQEEKELLNPSTIGMTLAMAGAELLEDEPPPPPPPGAPDTSKINLVPNFDV
ncbi:MAG: hypothetical protein NZ777_09295 [Pseudomonadales bacterium]|nr:hypothetical protein [Pseudomonadales bacterium]